jgi:thioesterase domain-containing protein
MMIKELIEELHQKGIHVSFSGTKLKYRGPEENITPELIEKLKKNKGKLLKYFWPEEFTNLMPINTEGTKKPLFIVHGDNANYIISEHLGQDQPVFGFFHHGSDGEKIPFTTVEGMAADYLAKVKSISPTGPYYLIGFSFGGVLAFEMAVMLQKEGQEVPLLIVIDSICPLAKEPIKWEKSLYMIIRKNILRPPRLKLKRLRKFLICKFYIFMNKPIPAERRKDYMYIKYMRMTKKYHPQKFNGNILLFRSTKNPSTYKHLGWESLVDDVRMIEIEGKHLEMFIGKERSELLATEIEKYMEINNIGK